MITRIELENFKGIREPVALDLKPITLLFGANSAGKSTIIHALHYAHEVLRNNNLDADRTSLGGDSVDLGGFRNLVHGHDDNRRIKMLFEFDADSVLPDYTEGVSDIRPAHRGSFGPNLEHADLDDRVLTAWVRFEVGWSRALRKAQVFSYEVGTNGNRETPLIRIESAAGRGQTASLTLRLDDAILDDDLTAWIPVMSGARAAAMDDGHMYASMPIYQESALPTWGRPLRLWIADDSTVVDPPMIEIRRIISKLAVGIGALLGRELNRLLYLGPLRTVPPRNYRPPLTDELGRWAEGLGAWDALHRRGPQFVGQVSEWMKRLGTGYRIELQRVREVPDASLSALQSRLNQFVHGAPDELGDALPTLMELAPLRKTKATKAIKVARPEPRPLGSAADAIMLRQALEDVRTASERDDLVLIDERMNIAVRPYDVGVGISQVLPVVVAAIYRGRNGVGAFVAIEQPELHIHPKLQVALADLFIEQSVRGTMSDHWFLLETHSEHILLRLLRRIRESYGLSVAKAEETAGVHPARSDGGIKVKRGRGIGAHRLATPPDEEEHAPTAPRFTPDQVSVIYVRRAEDGSTRFDPLRIDERGEFLDIWPEGFFEERDSELFG